MTCTCEPGVRCDACQVEAEGATRPIATGNGKQPDCDHTWIKRVDDSWWCSKCGATR